MPPPSGGGSNLLEPNGSQINDIFIYIIVCMCVCMYVSRSGSSRLASRFARIGSLQGSLASDRTRVGLQVRIKFRIASHCSHIASGRNKVGSLQGSFRFVSLQGSLQVPIPPLFFLTIETTCRVQMLRG